MRVITNKQLEQLAVEQTAEYIFRYEAETKEAITAGQAHSFKQGFFVGFVESAKYLSGVQK